MRPPINPGRLRVTVAAGALGLGLWVASAASTNVVLHLDNGDVVSGVLVCEDPNQVVVATSWMPALRIPVHAIAQRESPPRVAGWVTSTNPLARDAAKPGSPQSSGAENSRMNPSVRPAAGEAAAATNLLARQLWKTDVRVGADFQSGAKDRSSYFGTAKLTYEQTATADSRRRLRNVLEYRADYGETEGEKSVNRMNGSMKTDFDLANHWYLYNLGMIGYDEFRKIELGYEVGPGVGYHLFRKPRFALDTELGLNQQFQDRTDEADVESLYLRAAENLTWRLAERITFAKKFEFYPSLEDVEDFRFRFESTMSFGVVQNVSLHFSVLDVYDTRPARNVNRNELLVRSSLGLTF